MVDKKLTFNLEKLVVIIATFLAVSAVGWSFKHGYIIAYGDAESHLNIAKRVVSGLTPGFAQLGGIWLPLPHLLMVPLVFFDPLWRSGLAGSIISILAFIATAFFLFKLVTEITSSRKVGFVSALIFMANPNILYMQTTPMTELVLIAFFVISSFYFVKFIKHREDFSSLILAAFFGFCATLSRYDGWFLVATEAVIIILMYLPWRRFSGRWIFDKSKWGQLQGRLTLFGTLAFFGIILWLLWGYLILGDPLYFTHSSYSAKSQQQGWLIRGELPAYKNLVTSIVYYSYTSLQNIGFIIFGMALAGLIYFLFDRTSKDRFFIFLLLLAPFIFNVTTLYLGQSVIFVPGLTPTSFEWQLFNVRYGVMMVPFAAIFVGYLLRRMNWRLQLLLAAIAIGLQSGMYFTGQAKVLTFEDATVGLSSQLVKLPDAQQFMAKNYDGGLVLEDDFSRTLSIVRTSIPMQNIIYVGNRPYWQESLREPEKYATWIIMKKDDAVWKSIYEDKAIQGRLYAHFVKVYTSPDILIFKKNTQISSN